MNRSMRTESQEDFDNHEVWAEALRFAAQGAGPTDEWDFYWMWFDEIWFHP